MILWRQHDVQVAKSLGVWIAVAATLAASSAGTVKSAAPALRVPVNASTGAFSVEVGGGLWLRGTPPTAGWLATGRAALSLQRHTAGSGTHPSLGPYTEDRFHWRAADGTLVQTAVQAFRDNETVLMEQVFPAGVRASNTSDGGPVLAFPAFGAGGREGALGVVTWRSAFSQATPEYGTTLGQLSQDSLGRANGGPVAMFDEAAAYAALVVSPFDNFLAFEGSVAFPPPPPPAPFHCDVPGGACAVRQATDVWGDPKVHAVPQADNLTRGECCQLCTATPSCQAWARVPGERTSCWPMKHLTKMVPAANREAGCPNRTDRQSAGSAGWATWSNGVSGSVTSLPVGFTHRVILSTSARPGLTQALQGWGAKMRSAYGTRRINDVALSHLSYWTDNGAYYYMYSPKGWCDRSVHGRMDTLLLRLQASWFAAGLPVRSVQLDDWWYDSELGSHDHMCVKDWAPSAELFPTGLPQLAPNISYILYGPFWCQDNVYAREKGFAFLNASDQEAGNFEADPAPAAALSFYTELFREQKAKGVALSNYEVDFLQDQTTWFTEFVSTADGAARWLDGMGTAALAANVSVQFCMSHPAAFLEALRLPAVTNGRASGDYMTYAANLQRYGTAAPFFAAVGIAPSKDNFWSTADQPRPPTRAGMPPPCDGGSRNVTDSFLHALVATLSTGPVGFSDALGYSNATLLKMTCRSDGLILKPSLPLAAVDRMFRADGAHDLGDVWSTHTAVGPPGSASWYFTLAMNVPEPWNLTRADLYPPLAPGQAVVVWDHGEPEGARLVAPHQALLADMSTPGALCGSCSVSYRYLVTAPVDDNGWALLGELDKLTPVAVQRNWRVNAGAGLTVNLTGAVGEVVQVSVWKGGVVSHQSVIIDRGGEGFAIFTAGEVHGHP